MAELLYREFWWIQAALATTFLGVTLILWGLFSNTPNRVKWGLLAFLVTGLLGIPLYFNGQAIIEIMQKSSSATALETYQADYYTTLIVTFFLSITALMSLLMQKSLQRVPRIFLYPVTFYGLLVVGYLGWRTATQLP